MGVVNYTVIDGEIISESRDGTERDYVPDPLGSTVALIDNTQTQTDTFTYWPYGEERTRTGTTPTPFRYVGALGYYRDAVARIYVGARVLDTAKSRWITPDPIGFDGGDFNLFTYAGGSPSNLADPSGLQVLFPPVPGPVPLPIYKYPPKPDCRKFKFPKGPFKPLPGNEKNCKGYLDLCNKGYIYACNAYWACLHLAVWPPNSNECIRGCLQKTIPFSDIPKKHCDDFWCQHMHCFRECKGHPYSNYDWPNWVDICCYLAVPSPEPPKNVQCIATSPCPTKEGVDPSRIALRPLN
jgi:RHS repeat-associated protein